MNKNKTNKIKTINNNNNQRKKEPDYYIDFQCCLSGIAVIFRFFDRITLTSINLSYQQWQIY